MGPNANGEGENAKNPKNQEEKSQISPLHIPSYKQPPQPSIAILRL
jgi:hypothetical protein